MTNIVKSSSKAPRAIFAMTPMSTDQTRPILEAFWHTKYFLAIIAKYGKELQNAPQVLPSGWASVLCLFSLR